MKQTLIPIRLLTAVFFVLISSCATTQSPALIPDEQYLEDITRTHSIIELHQALVDGKLTSQQLVTFYLKKISEKDAQYNAVIATNPKAPEQAKVLDRELQHGQNRGLLHGIPVLLKDNIESKEMATTAGSLALVENFTERDAPLVSRLRQAGAIILGKANLSEWANFRSTRSSSGWSGVGGQTRNPHDLTRSTCGSSSGSGAAIAANLAVAAVGTETDGSITCPASATGVVGFKPTVGLVSQSGIVPISHSQDTAGPMAKNVTDAAILLAAMQGPDPKDRASTHYRFDFDENYLQSLQPQKLDGKRIGILKSPATNHEKVAQLFSSFIARLKQSRATLIENVQLKPYPGMFDDEYSVLLYEFKTDLNPYLSQLPNALNRLTLEKLIEYNQQHRQQEMPYFEQEIFELSQQKGSLDSQEYQQQLARLKKASQEQGLDKVFKEKQLDVIIAVTMGPAWKIDQINGDHFSGSISSYSAIAGYPHISIPLGKVHGLPVGLSIMGRAMEEKALLNFAYQFEAMLKQQPLKSKSGK